MAQLVGTRSEQQRLAYFDKALSARVLDLTAAHQHDALLMILSRFNSASMAPAPAMDDAAAAMDALVVYADASMGHGAGHGVQPDFWVNVAVEGAGGAAGALADAPHTRNLDVVVTGGGGAEAGPTETRHRVGDRATLLLRGLFRLR